MVVCIYNPSYTTGMSKKDVSLRLLLSKNADPIQTKNNSSKKRLGCGSRVKQLLSKHEALSSNSNTAKEKKKLIFCKPEVYLLVSLPEKCTSYLRIRIETISFKIRPMKTA
jgi:hypothetical protein